MVCKSRIIDKTYIKVKDKWMYLYRALDMENNTIDFLLTAKRDMKSAKRFFEKSIKSSGAPEKINIEIRQCKYLNNILEQDHQFIKK